MPPIPATFQHEGPQPIDTIAGHSPKVIAGAVQSVVVDPGNGNTVFIGSVNGGVWKTTDFRPGEKRHAPAWKHLTDHLGSLSISALDLDPNDKSHQTLVAAIGRTSSHSGTDAGPLLGILRTTDGGNSWTEPDPVNLIGQDLIGVVARGRHIAVASPGGVWFSSDFGSSFNHVAGTDQATSLVGDPQNPGDYWLAEIGGSGGIFRGSVSHDVLSFTQVGAPAVASLASGARRIVLSVQSYAPSALEVYAGVINPTDPAHQRDPDGSIGAIFRLWQLVAGTPLVTDQFSPDNLPPFEIASQGKLSLAADPSNLTTFFVAGDQGDLFRCVAPPGLAVDGFPLCTAISDRTHQGHTASGTAPHEDSRAMVFDGDHALIETDDGGIFLRNSPRTDAGDWFSRNGDLGISEAYSCAFDGNAKVILCGLQDNGTVLQPQPGSTVWQQVGNFDGGIVAVSPTLSCAGHPQSCVSHRYRSNASLQDFTHELCDRNNFCFQVPADLIIAETGKMLECDTRSDKTLCGDPKVSETTPFAANRFDPLRLVFATVGMAYESMDGGVFVHILPGFCAATAPTATRAILAGGRRNGSNNHGVLYIGSDQGLFLRTSSGGSIAVVSGWGEHEVRTRGQPMRIAVDPENWKSAWVITDKDQVWHAADSEGSWTQDTGLTAAGGTAKNHLRSIAYVDLEQPYLAVGASDGVYVRPIAPAGHWSKLTGALPNTLVYDLSYDVPTDQLLVATLGRSVWTMQNVKRTLRPLGGTTAGTTEARFGQ